MTPRGTANVEADETVSCTWSGGLVTLESDLLPKRRPRLEHARNQGI
jgi:hypothetical protein